MAVSIQTPLYSKSGMWNLGDAPPAFSTESDGIPVSMAYQYPSSGMDSSSMIPSYHHPLLDPTQPRSTAQAKPVLPVTRNRGTSSVSKSAKIKRSMSSPNVRGQANADAAALALSNAEKRRNKLGYHRTSVACGHCRRRKIRCIPAPADPQNRCSNCIRLKKECNFYPVDQQPPPEPKRRRSKSQSGTGRASESSSPSTTTSGQLPEVPSTLPYPHHLNMPPIQDLGGPRMKRQRTESFSPENKVVTSSRNFEYNHNNTNWMATDASPTTKVQAEVPQSFWRVNPQDSPLTPAFSPFTPSIQIPPSHNWPAPHTEPSPRDDLSWQAPQRSISYTSLEGLQSQHHYAPYSNPPSQSVGDNYTTKPRVIHSMYPPPISTSGSMIPAPESSSATSHDSPQHPHSAGPLPSFPAWQQPYSYQKPPTPGGEHYGGYSQQGGQLPHPTETGHSGAPPYGYGDTPGGVYYPAPSHHQAR